MIGLDPLLLVLSALILIGPALRLLKLATIGRPRSTNRCYECRYDLSGLADKAGVCPECGSAIVPVGTRPPQTPRRRVLLGSLGALLLAPLALTAWETHQILDAAGVLDRWFPEAALRRELARAGPPSFGGVGAAASVIKRYRSGGASDDLMRSAVRLVYRSMENDPAAMIVIGTGARRARSDRIIGASENEGSAALAECLDDAAISNERLTAILAAVADALKSIPIANTSQADSLLCDLVSGSRMQRYSGGSGTYAPRPDGPRRLTDAQLNLLIDALLSIQKDPNRPWNPQWGEAIERARSAGRVDDVRAITYLTQGLQPSVDWTDGQNFAAGDAVNFDVIPGWRSGSGVPVMLRIRAVEDEWRGRLLGEVTQGQASYANDISTRYTALLALPDVVGPRTLTLEVAASFGPDVIEQVKASFNPFDHSGMEPVWSSMPRAIATKRLVVPLELQTSDVPRVVEESGAVTPEDIDRMAGARIEYCKRGSKTVVKASLRFQPAPPIDVAFDAFLRQGTRQWPLGWSLAPRTGWSSMTFAAAVDGLNTGAPVDLVLKSSIGPLERPEWIPRIWKGEVIMKNGSLSARPMAEALEP